MLLQVYGKPAYCYTGGKPFDPALPCVVFIHGAQHDHSVWALQSRYFAHHGHAVLAPDLPGHGRSGGPALTSVDAMAQWILALLDAAGVEKALLAGHSMGSLIALQAAADAPQRVCKLALLATAFPMRVSPALLETSREKPQQAIDMVNIWSHSGIAQKPSFPGPGFSVQGGNRRLMQRIAQTNPEPVFHTDFSACNAYAGGEEAARAVTCPTLFLLGQSDQMTPPKAAARLTTALPQAKVTQLPCGHALMTDQPDAVLDHLFDFATA
ncbi:Pimeloyl-ACP methyl ester carboxylesterase [Noviherbaspirillum humi]|uniref:Pimeloyl-ACP methyl ester carboxylesterase n=1 Tax=Noviherbaspirillum humi TaxID=1688639 RepID=A0A239KR50_9BURK|nr:alpha/beta hydrolase [Noviherbaspirillum humi]SNT20535.1 Pimeloyl-ACP methyl ester carboxylesterase [Noviherbaspirillum humi]